MLTVTTNVWLNGTTWMKLDKGNATNDVLAVGDSLTYGGTLIVTNISATPLAVNDSYKLLPRELTPSAFTSISRPSQQRPQLGVGYQALGTSGTIKVVSNGPGHSRIRRASRASAWSGRISW